MISKRVLESELPEYNWSGGTAKDIMVQPHNSADDSALDFRISVATITAKVSQFSDFSGFMRIHQVLAGRSQLRIDDQDVGNSSPSSQYVFDGAKKCQCELLSNSLSAFNVMHRADVVANVMAPVRTLETASVSLLKPADYLKSFKGLQRVFSVFHCYAGSIIISALHNCPEVELRDGDTFVIQRTVRDKANLVQFEGDACLAYANLLVPR